MTLKTEITSIRRYWLLQDAPLPIRRTRILEYSGIIVLLLAVTWLGAQSLNADALWFDEVWTLYYAGGQEYGPISPVEVVSRVVSELEHEKNPPGYYVLLNLWGGAAGWSEYAGRALSLLVGVLAVAWTYRAGSDVGKGMGVKSRQVMGLAAAAAVGGSALFIYYTHELRAYSLMVLLSAIITALYWRLLRQKYRPSVMLQAAFTLAIAGALYVHYMTALVIGAIGLYHLLFVPKDRQWMRVSALALAGVALFLPWLPILFQATTGAVGLQTVAMHTPDMLRELLVVFSNASLALLVLYAGYGLVARGKRARFVRTAGIIALGLAAALNTVYPIVTHVRYLIAVWPLLALVVAVGVERLARRGLSPALLVGLWVAGGVWNTVDPNFNRVLSGETLPWREFRAELTQHGQPDDVVVFHAPDFNWFREKEIEHYLYGLPMRYSLMENIFGLAANDEYYGYAQSFVGDAPRVWVGIDRMLEPNFRLGEFQRLLEADYAPCHNAFNLPTMSLDLYARVPDTLHEMPMRFGDGIGAQLLEPMHVLADGEVSVLIGWLVDERVPPDTYSTGLHVMDASGNLAAQVDAGLPGHGYHCQQAEISLPPGEYTVYAVVYNWQTGERLTAVGDGMDEAGDRVEAGRIEAR